MRTVTSRWSVPLVLTLCAVPAAAQQFLDPRHAPAQHVLPPVDVTGDGLPDLVFVGNGAVTLRANDGQLRFPQSQALFTYTGFAGVFTPADLDGDNDVDFVVFDGYAPNAVALNVTLHLQQAGGTFTTVPLAPIAVSGSNVPLGCVATDIDNDGDRDLVLNATGPAGASLFALRNDGVPVFTEVTSTWFGTVAIESPLEVAAADIDGDARTDLLVRTATLHVLHNSGVQFVDETALRMPPGGVAALTMLVGNLDGDTDPDVVYAEPFTNLVRVLQNQNGVFADVSATHAPATPAGTAVCLLDVDRDGDRDLFAWQGGTASSGDPGFSGQVLRNDGTGRLLQPLAVPAFGPFFQQPPVFTAIDLEGDGDQDLAATGPGYALLRSSGAGAFTPDPAGARRAGLAFDVDGDGYRDLLDEFGVRLSRPGDQWSFTAWGGTGPSLAQPTQVGDIDGDGDLDLVTRQVWRNNGAGVFTVDPPAWLPLGVPQHSALGDFDGDGDLDVVSSGGVLGTARVDVFVNNGLGQFAFVGQLLGNRITTHLAVGDADGDTRTDILVSGRLVSPTMGCEPQLLLNQGGFAFTAQNAPPLSTRMRLVDLRGNGQVDVLADASGAARAFRLQAGAFVEVTATMLPPNLFGFVAIGDVDQDGDVDLVGNDLWRHNGTGGYTQEALGVAGAAQLVDVDGDRDLDLLTGTTLLWNREHQLHLPLDAHVGRSLRIDVSARPGHAVNEAAFVALSLQQLSPALVLPLGHVHLASIGAVIVVLPPNGSGSAAAGFVVPNAPALVGVQLFLQSLHVGPAGDGLSNLATTVIE